MKNVLKEVQGKCIAATQILGSEVRLRSTRTNVTFWSETGIAAQGDCGRSAKEADKAEQRECPQEVVHGIPLRANVQGQHNLLYYLYGLFSIVCQRPPKSAADTVQRDHSRPNMERCDNMHGHRRTNQKPMNKQPSSNLSRSSSRLIYG